jgi:hypothetical protein
MITFRTFSDPVTAGIAQDVLREHGIPCHLADENASAYTGARFAVPVRLLVPEDRQEEAQKILDSTDLALPPDFDPTKLEE